MICVVSERMHVLPPSTILDIVHKIKSGSIISVTSRKLRFPVYLAADPLCKIMNETESASVMLRVSGMTCQDCARHVKKAILGLEGVVDASVELESGSAKVIYRPDKLNPDDITALRIFHPPSRYSAAVEER